MDDYNFFSLKDWMVVLFLLYMIIDINLVLIKKKPLIVFISKIFGFFLDSVIYFRPKISYMKY